MRRHVLLIDDDTDSRDALALMLGWDGIAVETAVDGQHGWMAAQQRTPGVILLDLSMPSLSGEEFRNRQLRDPVLSAVPVLCVSALHDAHALARRLRMDGCYSKPVDFDAVIGHVRRLLAEQEIARPGPSRALGELGIAYRRRESNDTWHFCSNCSNWPTSNYDEQHTTPTTGEYCNECKVQQAQGACRS